MQVGRKGYFGVAMLAALLLALVAAIMAMPTAQSQSSVSCLGVRVEPQNVGTQGPDVIDGQFRMDGGARDGIKTFGGNDTVRGEADFSETPEGNRDFICLDRGNDTADGADKIDHIAGGRGDDILDGDNFPSPFRDFLFGMNGEDTHTGGQGDDIIRGGKQADDIDVGTGTVNAGADDVNGNRGADTINEAGDGAVDTVNGGPGTDTCIVDPTDNVTNCEEPPNPTDAA